MLGLGGIAYCYAIGILLAEFCRGCRFFMALFFLLKSDTSRLAPDRARLVVREIPARKGGGLNRSWWAVMSVMGRLAAVCRVGAGCQRSC